MLWTSAAVYRIGDISKNRKMELNCMGNSRFLLILNFNELQKIADTAEEVFWVYKPGYRNFISGLSSVPNILLKFKG